MFLSTGFRIGLYFVKGAVCSQPISNFKAGSGRVTLAAAPVLVFYGVMGGRGRWEEGGVVVVGAKSAERG